MIRALITIFLCIAAGGVVRAQTLEPRFYCNVPKGLNFVVGGYGYSTGGLSLDPALQVEDAELDVHTALSAYARTFDLFGQIAKAEITVPYTYLSGSAIHNGSPIERSSQGFGDPGFRLAYNFIGAPALTLPEFREYEQKLVLGTSLRVTAPLGKYDKDKILNIGQNRWTITPEIGLSRRFGPVLIEAATGVMFYTDNDDFAGQSKEQDPLFNAQVHLVYMFKNTIWISIDANWYEGGQSTVGGVERNDRIENSRYGATLSLPVTKRHSLKAYASSGIQTRTGTDFDAAGLAWMYRWGGGM
jgi:hypothetical protein